MRDQSGQTDKSKGTTMFLRSEPWFSRMRLLRLAYMLAIGAVVALVLWLVQSRDPSITPVQDPSHAMPSK